MGAKWNQPQKFAFPVLPEAEYCLYFRCKEYPRRQACEQLAHNTPSFFSSGGRRTKVLRGVAVSLFFLRPHRPIRPDGSRQSPACQVRPRHHRAPARLVDSVPPDEENRAAPTEN